MKKEYVFYEVQIKNSSSDVVKNGWHSIRKVDSRDQAMKAIGEIQNTQNSNNFKRCTERVRILEAKVSVVLEETMEFTSTEKMSEAEIEAKLAAI